jgi:hypothetical protein
MTPFEEGDFNMTMLQDIMPSTDGTGGTTVGTGGSDVGNGSPS